MPNPRITIGLAIAAAVCGLLLWTLERRRPEGNGLLPGRTQGLLFPRGLGDVDAVIVEQGGFDCFHETDYMCCPGGLLKYSRR